MCYFFCRAQGRSTRHRHSFCQRRRRRQLSLQTTQEHQHHREGGRNCGPIFANSSRAFGFLRGTSCRVRSLSSRLCSQENFFRTPRRSGQTVLWIQQSPALRFSAIFLRTSRNPEGTFLHQLPRNVLSLQGSLCGMLSGRRWPSLFHGPTHRKARQI